MEITERYYSHEEIADLLQRAKDIGFSLDEGSELEKLTIAELDRLVNVRQ